MNMKDPRRDYLDLPLFDGFPYLVTKIAGAMHHVIVLPSLAGGDLERLARRQWDANRLPTCLVLAADRALYLSEGTATWTDQAPRCDHPICDRLFAAEEFPATAELSDRERRLREFVASRRRSGYFVDRAHGRTPTAEERIRLTRVGPRGVPRGLSVCEVCRGWRGEGLLAGSGLVVDVFCFCQNHNRCARCAEQLRERGLDDCSYFEGEGKVLHVPAFTGLEHRCPQRVSPR